MQKIVAVVFWNLEKPSCAEIRMHLCESHPTPDKLIAGTGLSIAEFFDAHTDISIQEFMDRFPNLIIPKCGRVMASWQSPLYTQLLPSPISNPQKYAELEQLLNAEIHIFFGTRRSSLRPTRNTTFDTYLSAHRAHAQSYC